MGDPLHAEADPDFLRRLLRKQHVKRNLDSKNIGEGVYVEECHVSDRI
jgi:hypothetical protein